MRGIHKRIYSVPGFVRDAAAVAFYAGDLAGAYVAGSLEPALRERIWVTVSGVNACRYCLFVHTRWALREGVEPGESEALRDGDWSFLTEVEHQPAIDYVRRWAESDFTGPGPAAAAAFERAYRPRRRAGIRAVARFANVANRTGNTFDALLERLAGRKAHGSRLIDEVAVSLVFLSASAVVAPAMMFAERQTPWALLREFRRPPGPPAPLGSR
jgi:AhpD family alkylhydroperoxidase